MPKAKRDGIFVKIKCPGCGLAIHALSVERSESEPNIPVWAFNNNYDRPTFTPSLLVRTGKYVPGHEDFDDEGLNLSSICHSFITDGRIQFFADCTHDLAGQTVDLPELG